MLRGTYRQPTPSAITDVVEARIIRFLSEHGPSLTREISREGFGGGGPKHGTIVSRLHRLEGIGHVVAIDKPTTERGGRPGKLWRLA
jgi:DNA-binding PadR family transcriptional regulator